VQRYIIAIQSDIAAVPNDIAATSCSFTPKSNTTATVLFPAKNADAITESGKPLSKAPGVKFLRMDGDRAVLEVEAGSYRFERTVK